MLIVNVFRQSLCFSPLLLFILSTSQYTFCFYAARVMSTDEVYGSRAYSNSHKDSLIILVILTTSTLCFKKTGTLFVFLRLFCVLLTNLKNISQYCSKGNLQQNTHFKFYIYEWYLIVNQAESTSSTATVDINLTQQNPKLKLVTQFEMNAKHSKRRS